MDLTHKDENTESTEERTIMMDSIKALHTGEVRNEDSSYDSGYESVHGGEESHSGDGEPAEDEVTEEDRLPEAQETQDEAGSAAASDNVQVQASSADADSDTQQK